MLTNSRRFNEGAVVSGNTGETSIIRCSTHYGCKVATDYMVSYALLAISLMFTNCCNFNKGAVVSGNTDETRIIRRNTH